jgi:hypothetical protein
MTTDSDASEIDLTACSSKICFLIFWSSSRRVLKSLEKNYSKIQIAIQPLDRLTCSTLLKSIRRFEEKFTNSIKKLPRKTVSPSCLVEPPAL